MLIPAGHVADIAAAARFGVAAQVVLHFVLVVALIKPVGIAPVGQPLQFAEQARVKRTSGKGVVNGTAIDLRRPCDVVGRFGAPFDLQRINANVHQAPDMLDRTQITGIHDVAAVFVLFDGHQLAGTFAFFEQPDIPGRIRRGGLQLVIPAAGIGATALIRIAPVEVAGEQAAPGIGDTQGTMNEYFKFNIRTLLANLGDFIQREFAREDDAGDTELLPEAHGGKIDGIGLHRKMDRHLRPVLAHQINQAGVGHDQRVRLQGDHRGHVGQISLDLDVMRQNVAHQIKGFSSRMRFIQRLPQNFQRAEFVVAHAQAVTRLPGIDGVGTEGKGGAHHVQRSGRGEKFRGHGEERYTVECRPSF